MKKFYTMIVCALMALSAHAEDDATTVPGLSVTEEVKVAAGDEAKMEMIFYGGSAPYTIEWKNPKGEVVKTETLTEPPLDMLTCAVKPTECGDYTVTVTEAGGQKGTATIRVITTGEAGVANFEGLYLASESYNNGASADGSDRIGSFVNGSYSFSTHVTYGGAAWSGFAYSNSTSAEYASLADQYKSSTGSGYDGSENFVVVYDGAPYSNAPVITVLSSEEGAQLNGCYVTNSAYAYHSMTQGDSYTQPLAQGGWFKVRFTADNGKAVDYYLADLRSENASEQYILNTWDWVDLSTLGTVKTVTISFDGSDKGAWGLNTPAYVCIDNFNDVKHATPSHPTYDSVAAAYANGANSAAPAIYDINGVKHNTLQPGINIIRMSDGTVRKVMK